MNDLTANKTQVMCPGCDKVRVKSKNLKNGIVFECRLKIIKNFNNCSRRSQIVTMVTLIEPPVK